MAVYFMCHSQLQNQKTSSIKKMDLLRKKNFKGF